MDGTRKSLLAIGLAALFAGCLAAPALAATREPLSRALHPASLPLAWGGAPRPSPAALRAMVRSRADRLAEPGAEFQISSSHFGPAAVASVAATIRSLDHGPELASLSVYVATPAEIRRTCGAAVVACYVPSESLMVVSGVDRPVAGVPRVFAIAHEYGHHIANSRQSSALPALEAGTIRWATYERVCQLSRRGRLFPGNQGAHYWEDPEEAFAQSYADLNRSGAGVSWEYTPLLAPSTAALAKLHADVRRPWAGPVTRTWSAATPPGSPVTRSIPTPLDGRVSVSLGAAPGSHLVLTLRDRERGRVVAHAATGADGSARLSYSNCGHASFLLEVRGDDRGAAFEAAITRP